MRILLTTDTVGGVWTFTCELVRQLLAKKHAVALVSFGRAPSRSQYAWCEDLAAAYVSNFLFQASTTPLEWMQDHNNAFSGGVDLLQSIANDFRADLLHANQFCWGALPGELPRLVTAHSDVLSWASSCRPEGLADSQWLTKYCRLVQRGLDCTDVVVAPTAWMRRALKKHFHVPCDFTVIHNGRTVPEITAPQERKLQAVSAGRLWDEAKGLKRLLSIEAPLPILVAGEDNFEQASISTDKLQPLGQLRESALFDLFRSSSIYIATSVYEPFGLAPLEAALCGCAVVAQNISSLREVWADAALFYDEPEELSLLLRNLVESPERLRSAQQKAQRRAKRFNAARMADKYLALYESLVTRSNATSSSLEELVNHAA